MILFCGVILSTSTYTWFTANKTVTINDITVNVAAMNGLQIFVDAINWKPQSQQQIFEELKQHIQLP